MTVAILKANTISFEVNQTRNVLFWRVLVFFGCGDGGNPDAELDFDGVWEGAGLPRSSEVIVEEKTTCDAEW